MRLGLSGYGNPVQAGIDAFTQVNQVLNQNERLELDKQDAVERREVRGLERRKLENQIADQEAEKPVKQMKREYEMLKPFITSALTKLHQSAKGNTLPEFTTEEHAAIQKIQKDSPYLFNDPKGMYEQAQAVNGLLQAAPQMLQNLQGHAKQTGQTKFIVNEQNAPGVVSGFNKVFGQAYGEKEYPELYVDLENQTVTPVHAEGPLQDEENKIKSIPISQLQNVATRMQQFGTLVLASHAQIGGDEKRLKEVETALNEHNVRGKVADALDDFGDWLSKDGTRANVNQRRVKLQSMLVKAGMDEKQAVSTAKEQIQEKEHKYQKAVSGTSDVLLEETPEGVKEVWKGDAQPKKEDDPELKGLRKELIKSQIDDKRTRISEKKEADAEKRRDKLINENLGRLAAAPDWKDKEYDERRAEAERLADAQIAGKPTGREKNPIKELEKRVEPLKQKFSQTSKGVRAMGMQAGGSDIKALIDDAYHNRKWTEQEIRQAAIGTPAEDDVNEYDFREEKKPAERKGLSKASKETDRMPIPSEHKGKILRDKSTGKRYKSDGKSWNEIT